MLDSIKRAVVPIVAAAISILAIVVGWKDLRWLWLLVLTVPVIVLGAYDWWQTRWTITRNYPVAGRIRWLFYDLRPYLRAYIVEDDLTGTPYSFEARNLVHARARGESDSHPFGTERNTDDKNYYWLLHSISPESDPDESQRIEICNEQTGQPYSASVLNISARLPRRQSRTCDSAASPPRCGRS